MGKGGTKQDGGCLEAILRFFGGLLLVGIVVYVIKWFTDNEDETPLSSIPLPESGRKNIEECAKLNRAFEEMQKQSVGYFSDKKLRDWKLAGQKLVRDANDIRAKFAQIEISESQKEIVTTFLKNVEDGQHIRAAFNKRFLQQELKAYNSFFDNVEGRKLDLAQRTAVVTDEDNSLVIAGAGSGKTTTIVGKVQYVLERYKVKPEEVLLISYTRNAAQELANRIAVEGLDAQTFHKFGKEVVAEVTGKQPSVFDGDNFSKLIQELFEKQLQDASYQHNAGTFLTELQRIPKQDSDFKHPGEYYQHLKDEVYRPYKQVTDHRIGRQTIRREIVKSVEECAIANFLIFNGVEYVYEKQYPHPTADRRFGQYKPDFTIAGKEGYIYLEHFGIDRNGNVPSFFADASRNETREQASRKYQEGIAWKEAVHQRHGTQLLRTHSYEFQDGTWKSKLQAQLEAKGIVLQPMSDLEIWELIQSTAPNEVKGLLELFETFITLMKSNNQSLDSLAKKASADPSPFMRKRHKAFFELLAPIYSGYEAQLKQTGELDFSDLINLGKSYIEDGQYRRRIRYVIIDEFQDISVGRYALLKAVQAANPGVRFFCVGDDWQSIYRFGGSDIFLFKEFEKYFGTTERMKLETTYRFHEPLIGLSSNFILQNENQQKKAIRSSGAKKETKAMIHYSEETDGNVWISVKSILDGLIADKQLPGKKVMVLGRYGFDFRKLRSEHGDNRLDEKSGILHYTHQVPDATPIFTQVEFLTVHKAKGKEADIVIVVNCDAGLYGFPSGMADDKVLELVLSEADRYPNGEERRLFYVAMTRAKEQLYLVATRSMKSKFILELEPEGGDKTLRKCPDCRTGDLVKRSGRNHNGDWAFDSCSNFSYGCGYQKWL
jgi:DNA helicase-4